MKGKFKDDKEKPNKRRLGRIYEPLIRWCMMEKKPRLELIFGLLISIPIIMNLGRGVYAAFG